MTSNVKFDELALKYVLAVDNEKEQHKAIAEQAAQAIHQSTNQRIAVGQWVASVSRWMQSSGDDDLISRSRALDFLASTLQVLSGIGDNLNPDQVKLLVTFFCSLFENDHKAGVMASAKALRQLIVMRHFRPALGHDIIQGVCKLKDDFKLQAPGTRLELYKLFWSLLDMPPVAYDLEYQHGSPGVFILDLLDLCRNERDPENLMLWFSILKAFLQRFNLSPDTTTEVFKAFSAYFPISLRPSATPSVVTTENLKITLRSCFSAHSRVASLAIPFLVDKLDKVDQTVAVKVDILLTLDACLNNYDDSKQSVVPYADQIWSSLKYEVRNGEIQDIIKATLKVLCSLTRRLDGEVLESFLDNAWRDLKEDLSDAKYTAQAGRLLVALTGAAAQSFSLLIPRALELMKKNIKHTTLVLHKRHLITLMSSLLNLRLLLVPDLQFNTAITEDVGLLSDDLFGDSLFHDLYLPFWQEHSASLSPVEYIGILRETMQGLGALVGQKASGNNPQRLCSDSTCETILSFLAKPVIICPLEGPKYIDSVDERVPQHLLEAGEEALRSAVPSYPPAFRSLLLQYLTSVKAAYRLQPQPDDLVLQLRNVSASLCAIILSDSLNPEVCWIHEAALINTFLQGLHWMVSERADPTVLAVFIDAIHVMLKRAMKKAYTSDENRMLTKELFRDFSNRVSAADAPRIDLDRPGKIEALEQEETGFERPRRAFCLFVVWQLYRRFTIIAIQSSIGAEHEYRALNLGSDSAGNSPDLILRQDLFLNKIGQLATSVVSELTLDEQKSLELDREAFGLFRPANSIQGLTLSWCVSPADDFRTAPLSLGILQGLWPGAMDSGLHLTALDNLAYALMNGSMPSSETARAAMDTILTVLSNKLVVGRDAGIIDRRLQLQETMFTKLRTMLAQHQLPHDTSSIFRIFRSILHYIAGDVICLRTEPFQGTNTLLAFVVQVTPTDIMLGRQFAQNLGLILMPRECLSEANHAIRKKLGVNKVYHRIVRSYFDRCFPGPGVDEREAVNRAVAIFSILRHLEYSQYVHDEEMIVRIGIRSLSTFKVGLETESLLVVLLRILEEDPGQLKPHLGGLIQGLIAIHGMARNVAEAARFKPGAMPFGGEYRTKATRTTYRDPIPTRLYTLQFLKKLTESGYEAHVLLLHRRGLLRPLANACGDSVREIRQTALKARLAWEALG